jgi:hypothetical protein
MLGRRLLAGNWCRVFSVRAFLGVEGLRRLIEPLEPTPIVWRIRQIRGLQPTFNRNVTHA